MRPPAPTGTPVDPAARAKLVGTIPVLRAFACALAGDLGRGDDLVQETLVRAWTKVDGDLHDADVAAWLFTILRDRFHAERRCRPMVDDEDGPAGSPGPEMRPEPAQLLAALKRLPDLQREALILACAPTFTHREAAAICGVSVAAYVGRVRRGRARLVAELGIAADAQAATGLASAPDLDSGRRGRGSGRPNR